LLYPNATLVTIVSEAMNPMSPRSHARIRCRNIKEADFPAIANLLSRSFTKADVQLLRLRRIAERNVPAGLQLPFVCAHHPHKIGQRACRAHRAH
jgi:hypothetical protein